MRLTAAEVLALQVVDEYKGRVTGVEVGGHLGLTERSGRRILTSLVRKGALSRTRRGHYKKHPEAAERTNTAVQRTEEMAVVGTETSSERTEVTVSQLPISTTSSKSPVLSVDPYGSTTKGGGAPGEAVMQPGKISDDSTDNGWDEFDPSDKTAKRPKPAAKNLKFHRLKERSAWTMQDVTKEFSLRAHHAYQDRLFPSDGKSLMIILRKAQRDHDLTPESAAAAVDAFFDTDAHKVPVSVKPHAAFANFLERFVASQGLEVTEDLVAEFTRRNEGRVL